MKGIVQQAVLTCCILPNRMAQHQHIWHECVQLSSNAEIYLQFLTHAM